MAQLFAPAGFRWWIAGGHAIDHAVGRQVRPHGDIDVLILRADHLAARALLADWECHAAEPPGTLRPWSQGDALPPTVSNVWCRPHDRSPWRLQLMIDEVDGEIWRSRRAAAVAKPIAELGSMAADGTPYLTPEVQLYYKAKAPRPKDLLDFAAALPCLTRAQGAWLKQAVAIAYRKKPDWTIASDGRARVELAELPTVK